ncbi:MAG: hypothetical protein ACE5G5_13025 [Candidatus Methylomirabilales bacterium]
MKRVACALFIGALLTTGFALPAEARHRHHKHRRHRGHHHIRHIPHHGHGHGHFAAGFLAGAATVLVADALYPPRVVHTTPVFYQPVYYQAPVCRDFWVPGRWEVRTQRQNGFTSYYQVWVEGHWQRHCT